MISDYFFKFNHREKKVKGSVLFIVLMFVVFITSIILLVSLEVKNEVKFVENELLKFQSYVKSFSGGQYILNRLLTGRQTRAVLRDIIIRGLSHQHYLDGSPLEITFLELFRDDRYKSQLPEDISKEIEKIRFSIQIQDCAGLINLRRIKKDLFANFLNQFEVKERNAKIIYDSIQDWTDPDDLPRLNGAEKEYYNDNNIDSFEPPNREILAKEELLLVRGIKQSLYEKIKNYLDFSPIYTGLNPNTIPRKLFKMFTLYNEELSEEIIDKIIEERKLREFVDFNDFNRRTPYDFVPYKELFRFFTSDTYYITIESEMKDSQTFYIQCKISYPHRVNQTTKRQPPKKMKMKILNEGGLQNFYFIHSWTEGIRHKRNERMEEHKHDGGEEK